MSDKSERNKKNKSNLLPVAFSSLEAREKTSRIGFSWSMEPISSALPMLLSFPLVFF
jgi:hypothetical protein